jgi:glycerol-1-phosphate dehydrogenase [NAD(P)+]
MEIPWELARARVSRAPEQVIFVPNTKIETLERIASDVDDGIELVAGIGGGSSHDCAKFVAMKKGARLIQFPTVFGGDAVVTSAIGIRRSGKVEYVGHVITDKIYVDYDLIHRAPEDLIRYGAADILSSYTALKDWELAASRGLEPYVDAIASYARDILLRRLEENAEGIRKCADDGIRTIVEVFQEYHILAQKLASDRPQEGSEHFVAYAIEMMSGRSFLHGRLLAIGIWFVANFLYEDGGQAEQLLRRLGLRYDLHQAGLTREEFEHVLRNLTSYVQASGYYYSILHESRIDDALIARVLEAQDRLRTEHV